MGITDAGLAHLQALPAYEELNLGLKPLTDSGLIQLGHLTGLRKLGLAETKITDGGLSHLDQVEPASGIGYRGARQSPARGRTN